MKPDDSPWGHAEFVKQEGNETGSYNWGGDGGGTEEDFFSSIIQDNKKVGLKNMMHEINYVYLLSYTLIVICVFK